MADISSTVDSLENKLRHADLELTKLATRLERERLEGGASNGITNLIEAAKEAKSECAALAQETLALRKAQEDVTEKFQQEMNALEENLTRLQADVTTKKV